MRWIDFENKKPTDTNIPNWIPWAKEEWEGWLDESAQLHEEVGKLDAAFRALEKVGRAVEAKKKLAERNKFIDDHSKHWES